MALAADVLDSNVQSAFSITRIYNDDQGESHFDDHYIEIENKGDIGFISRWLPCSAISFRMTPSSYHYSWHRAPRRQFIVNLDADVRVTVSTGETRVLKRGEVFFVEDTEGKGHYSMSVGNEARHSIFVSVPDDFKFIDLCKKLQAND